jgi:hypothetical protein
MTGQRNLRGVTRSARVQAVVPLGDIIGLIRLAKPLIDAHLEYYDLESMTLPERRDRIAGHLEEEALRQTHVISTYETGYQTSKDYDLNAKRAAGHARKLLSDQAKELLDKAKQLRSLSPRMLAILDESITAFVVSERVAYDDGLDDGTVESFNFFLYWIKRKTFVCRSCRKTFVSVGSLRGGRRRQACSNACKQSAFRQRRQVS